MSEGDRIYTCTGKADVFDHPRVSDNGFREWLKNFGGPRCGRPALYETINGPHCERCAERLREAARNPHTVMNVLGGGRARTEEEIARLVRPYPN